MKRKQSPSNLIDLYEDWGVDMAFGPGPFNKIGPLKDKPQESRKTRAPFFTQEVQFIRDRIQKVLTLDQLRGLLEDYEGCALKKTATKTVFGYGALNPRVMIVGEAPGADEDVQGKPFVGKSGMLLDNILKSVGLSRETNVYIGNIIPWRPPGNRPPTLEETSLCLPFIERHIELICPQVLLIAGAVATKSLLGLDSGITRFRGQWMMYTTAFEKKPIKAMPIFHPAYLLRSPGQKQKVWQDMLRLKTEFLDLQK